MEKITEEEILKALKRSGYLLENRVLKYFLSLEFWSESSHRFLIDGEDKFREIDIIASKSINSYTVRDNDECLTLYIHFFCECINSPQPLGVFKNIGDTEQPASDWNYEFINGSANLKETSSFHWDYLIERYQNQIFDSLPARQYCGFSEKKASNNKDKDPNRWMASHSDDFHQTLTKLVSFVKYMNEKTKDEWEGIRPSMGRLDLFIPLIVLQNEIIEITSDDDVTLKEVDYYRLKVPYENSYHNKSLSIDIIKEAFLESYLKNKINVLKLMFNDLKKHLRKNYG